jgi:hypothetical protein
LSLPSGFSSQLLYGFLVITLMGIRLSHHILLDMTLPKYLVEITWYVALYYAFLHLSVTFSLQLPVVLSNLFN